MMIDALNVTPFVLQSSIDIEYWFDKMSIQMDGREIYLQFYINFIWMVTFFLSNEKWVEGK